MLGDGCEGLMEENGNHGAACVLWDFSWWSVVVFSDGGGVVMVDSGGGNRLCVWVEMWK